MKTLSFEDRNKLDKKVSSLSWTQEALAFGSDQRRLVASWVVDTDLVDSIIRDLFPQPNQCEQMIEFTKPRIIEKIIGVELISKSDMWNWNNLWDPTRTTSFCAWVRRTSRVIALRNARRELHKRTIDDTTFENEEGYNRVWDDAKSTNIFESHVESIFDTVPSLKVPRPVGEQRKQLLSLLSQTSAYHTVRYAQRLGWWDCSLDEVDDEVSAALLLTPINYKQMEILPKMLPSHWQSLGHLYAPTQAKGRVSVDEAGLRRMVSEIAQQDHLLEWNVWLRLGTAAAQLAVG
ncbi:hypothetical protein [Bombiscardovia coagulans]|uniref:Uncharacterized protein n=1 Tax=Bombiscardovia coagulans TaxID=686666 RepID=A0A261ET68_9BIFI|nr:hypothetical protein [Bombiscardovia coagulans]OZG49856.1 hypothetical protein BOCO_0373 [Bombiscardovia coagulans]